MRAAALLLAGVAAAAPAGAQEGFQRAWELVGEERFAPALEAAAGEEEALWRARAEVLVRHHAGDLRGALAAGRAGLASAPDDPWLLQQTAYVAASLHHGGLAAELAERLGAGLDLAELDEQERARYRTSAEELAQEAADLLRAGAARQEAVAAARRTVLIVLALALALLAWLALSPVEHVGRRAPLR